MSVNKGDNSNKIAEGGVVISGQEIVDDKEDKSLNMSDNKPVISEENDSDKNGWVKTWIFISGNSYYWD